MAARKKKQVPQTTNSDKGGQPTLYTEERRAKFLELYATGKHTVSEMCAAVGWSQTSYYVYKKQYPEFSEACKQADAERLQQLGKMARGGMEKLLGGYKVTETTTRFDLKRNGTTVTPVPASRLVTEREVLPNARMVEFVLINADPEMFKSRKELQAALGDPEDEWLPLEYLTDKEFKQLQSLLNLARERQREAEAAL